MRAAVAQFVNGAANALPASLFLFFVVHRLEAPGQEGPLLILYFVSAIVGAPLWSWLAGRSSKHRVWCGAMMNDEDDAECRKSAPSNNQTTRSRIFLHLALFFPSGEKAA